MVNNVAIVAVSDSLGTMASDAESMSTVDASNLKNVRIMYFCLLLSSDVFHLAHVEFASCQCHINKCGPRLQKYTRMIYRFMYHTTFTLEQM